MTRAVLSLIALGVAVLPASPVVRRAPTMVVTVEGRGEVQIRLHTAQAPKTTAQIVRLARQGFYDGQKFFRVVKEPKPFLVQTGDPASRSKQMGDPSLGQGGSGTRVPYEDSGFPNVEGAVGLSTLPNDRDSGDSQFYILLGPARFLDGSYTVFGQVTSGMSVVKSIEVGDRITSVKIVGD